MKNKTSKYVLPDDVTPSEYTISIPNKKPKILITDDLEEELSEYYILFAGIKYYPNKDKTPSAFFRFMTKHLLGLKWGKDSKEEDIDTPK